jgi:peptidoglycan hydrolase CwlO-like protein
MTDRIKRNIKKAGIMLVIVVLTIAPVHVVGEVKPITDVEDKLEGISDEEKKVLEELFTITQKINKTKQEHTQIIDEIDTLQVQITGLEAGMEEMQKEYDDQLGILEKVLVNYQRGGPASYLEILLSADNLTTFLKSINLIKDISRNVGELLDGLEKGKLALQAEKLKLDEKVVFLEEKKTELQENIHKNQLLQQEQEDYLASLQEERAFYQEQLGNLEQMWTDCTVLFPSIVDEITRIIGEGYFTAEDLNLSFGFARIQGAIIEDTFNQLLKENSKLPETIFRFQSNEVIIEVPEKHLILYGNFMKSDESAIQYEVERGTFYEMPLEEVSMEELFQKGPLIIDFKVIAGVMVNIDFTINKVESQEKALAFEITPEW